MASETFGPALAAIIRARQSELGIPELTLSEQTFIPKTTLRRRLADGEFRPSELAAICNVLGLKASDVTAAAEVAA